MNVRGLWWLAAESLALPRGGISAVWRATGMSRPVIRQGVAELKNPKTALMGRVRRPGGGRKRIAERDAAVRVDLEKLGRARYARRSGVSAALDVQERATPGGGIRSEQGHEISYPSGGGAITEVGYSLQANRKTTEGDSHPGSKRAI